MEPAEDLLDPDRPAESPPAPLTVPLIISSVPEELFRRRWAWHIAVGTVSEAAGPAFSSVLWYAWPSPTDSSSPSPLVTVLPIIPWDKGKGRPALLIFLFLSRNLGGEQERYRDELR